MLSNFSHFVATFICAAQLGSTAAIFTTTLALNLPVAPTNILQASNISSFNTLSSLNSAPSLQTLPSLPLSKDTLDSLSTFLSLVVAIPDDILQSQGGVSDLFTGFSACIKNAAPEGLSEFESVTSQIGGGISTALVVASSFETRISSAAGALVTEVHTIIDNQLSKALPGASDISKVLPALTSFLGSEASVHLPKASSLVEEVKSKFSEAVPKASSLLAGAESKVFEAIPKATSLIASRISEEIPKATSIIASRASEVLPKASSVVENIESKIGEGIPKVTSLIGSKVGEAAPKITAAIGSFLHGIGFRRDVGDEVSAVGKCLGIEAISDSAIKVAQCVVGIAGSQAAVDLAGLKTAINAAGGILEILKGFSANNLQKSGLEILNKIIGLGNEINGCDLLV